MLSTKITLSYSNDKEYVHLSFPYDFNLKEIAKKQLSATWLKSEKVWQVASEPTVVNRIFNAYKGKAWVDYRALETNATGKNMAATLAKKPKVAKIRCT